MVPALLECLCSPGAGPAWSRSRGLVFPSPIPGYWFPATGRKSLSIGQKENNRTMTDVRFWQHQQN